MAILKKLPTNQEFINKLTALKVEIDGIITLLNQTVTPSQLFFESVNKILVKNFIPNSKFAIYLQFGNVVENALSNLSGTIPTSPAGVTVQAGTVTALNQGAELKVLQEIAKLANYTVSALG